MGRVRDWDLLRQGFKWKIAGIFRKNNVFHGRDKIVGFVNADVPVEPDCCVLTQRLGIRECRTGTAPVLRAAPNSPIPTPC